MVGKATLKSDTAVKMQRFSLIIDELLCGTAAMVVTINADASQTAS